MPTKSTIDTTPFKHNGKWYKAAPTIRGCEGCAFLIRSSCGKDKEPNCFGAYRPDHQSVIFVEPDDLRSLVTIANES